MADNWSSYMCWCNHPRNTHRFVHESRCWSYREGKACMEILKREREFVPVVCKLSVQAATVSSLTFSRRHSHRLKFPIIIHHMNQFDAQTIRDELSLSILAVFRLKDLDVFISFWQKKTALIIFFLKGRRLQNLPSNFWRLEKCHDCGLSSKTPTTRSNQPFPSLYRPGVQSCFLPSKQTVPGSQSKQFSGHHYQEKRNNFYLIKN